MCGGKIAGAAGSEGGRCRKPYLGETLLPGMGHRAFQLGTLCRPPSAGEPHCSYYAIYQIFVARLRIIES